MARDITALHPDLQVAAAKLKEICKAHGISINYSECLRTKAEQDALYAKGRTAPGKIVTKAKGSSYSSQHQWGVAIDFYLDMDVDGDGQKADDAFNDSTGLFKRVADLAKAFGCHVIYYSTTGKNNQPGYERVEFDELLAKSDIVSVHAPLTEQTEGLLNAEAFSKMKPSAIFLNLGRGPIVVEKDLADALENKTIAGAGLDVLTVEPMSAENPLKRIKDSDRLIITPHIAWASLEARTRLMKIIEGQIRDFFDGSDK